MRWRISIPLALTAFIAAPIAAQEMNHDDHAGHAMSARDPEAALPPSAAAPEAPKDHAADAYFDPAEMAKARDMLRYESGGMPNSKLMIDRLEWSPVRGGDGYAWEVEGWTGGDINRVAIKSKGEGAVGATAGKIELQAGWFHALDPWFNLRAGVRQDLQPRPHRTHAVVAVEGLAPYWFEVEGELFLSNKGEVTARAEASYDQRITQSLILQPWAEVALSVQNIPELRTGRGLTSIEMGLRLRYEIVREFAPYIGMSWERRLNRTARYAEQDGEEVDAFGLVAGVRLWF